MTTLFKMMLVQAMPTKVVQALLLRPRRSLVPVAQEQGLQVQLAVGFRTADTDNHGNDTGLKADLQVSGAPAVVVFSRYGV